MAITKPFISQLMLQAKKHCFGGHALQLGRQEIWVDFEELTEIARLCSFELKHSKPPELIDSQFLRGKKVVSDKFFFKSLGFSSVSSLDVSSFEDATYIHDLNVVPIPEELQERFDVIYELGTMEHVFHVPNVLANIHSMLRTDGYVVHASPCSNAFEHGFYTFSPCFFFDYYSTNLYEVIDSSLVRYRVNWQAQLTDCEVLECPPGSKQLALLSYIGSLDERYYAINVVVRKTKDARAGLVPQQGYYRKIWNKDPPEGWKPKEQHVLAVQSLPRRVFQFVQRVPFIGQLITKVVHFFVQGYRRRQLLRWKKIST